MGAEPACPKDVIAGEEKGHEGEGTAAKRLIEDMIALYGDGFFHILTTDAYYANKPFVLFLDSLGKYLVSRVKDARTTLYKEIETLSQMVEPIYVDDRENRVESLIYEIPELSVFPRSRRPDTCSPGLGCAHSWLQDHREDIQACPRVRGE